MKDLLLRLNLEGILIRGVVGLAVLKTSRKILLCLRAPLPLEELLGAKLSLIRLKRFHALTLTHTCSTSPKLTGFKKVSQGEVSTVIAQLNNRSRKTLGYAAPAKLIMAEHMALLRA